VELRPLTALLHTVVSPCMSPPLSGNTDRCNLRLHMHLRTGTVLGAKEPAAKLSLLLLLVLLLSLLLLLPSAPKAGLIWQPSSSCVMGPSS
jgi:hypothetical protein